jgi:alpha,alpha-trehalase
MKRMFLFFTFYFLLAGTVFSQTPLAPNIVYGKLFVDVQMNHIFPDNKTFVDCIPKHDPSDILASYIKIKGNPTVRYSLKKFVTDNFQLPISSAPNYQSGKEMNVQAHIRQLWHILERKPDSTTMGSSLLALPNPYIVPGGRFREIYYWDSYFTMLGLQESGETAMIKNMVDNFAYLISRYGHIPNGNRTYYLSRSQPPFFALMVTLLAQNEGDAVFAKYLETLQNEYDYWMDKTGSTQHAVTMPDGSKLNRYYDQDAIPRQESFAEDSTLGKQYKGNRQWLYRNLRSCAESGWDFSSRWFMDGKNLSTIQVTNLVPVDLNCLLFNLEGTLAKAYRASGNLLQENVYNQLAEKRKRTINKYLYNRDEGWYYDYNSSKKKQNDEKTIAGFTPFFFNLAPRSYIQRAAKIVETQFLKPGGIVTTLKNTGQQWDAPNGWAPLQWLTIKGLENYGMHTLATKAATRWVNLNVKVYKATGKLMEKYNVTDMNTAAGGGEYPSQDGFGWTNGVLLKLMDVYRLSGN